MVNSVDFQASASRSIAQMAESAREMEQAEVALIVTTTIIANPEGAIAITQFLADGAAIGRVGRLEHLAVVEGSRALASVNLKRAWAPTVEKTLSA